ncbi:MAG: peptidase [Bacteroidetes bacterium]|nr:peptidase [Bacteroidota bacterium]
MRKTLFLVLFFSFLQSAFAKADNNLITLSDTNIAPGDTVPYVLDEEEMMDYNDSLVSFPAYDLYCGWDTVNIHSAKFNVATLKDTSKNILLYNEQSCGYVHPFEGKITSSFGPRKRRYHYGVDIDLETGDCVAAAFDGKVRIAKKSKSYGNVIVITMHTYQARMLRSVKKCMQDKL